jgi:signal transduction histidine kinase
VDALARFVGAEEDWQRPAPGREGRRADVWMAAVWFVVAALGQELVRSIGAMESVGGGTAWQHVAIASASALLVWRRSHPLAVAGASAVHMFVVGALIAPVMAAVPMQALYFFALYSGVAWARDRRAMVYVVAGVLTLMFCWLAWMFALGSGVEELRSGVVTGQGEGPFPAIPAGVAYVFLINVLYFGGALLIGQVAWRGALRTAQVVDQAETIRQQSGRLRDQAVVGERLRIARELHDVVAHHVSVMGVQAAAARRVLTRDPEAARAALRAVETSSRDAVGQMRGLLGTLRSGELAADAQDARAIAEDRAPQPTLADLADLVAQADTPTCSVDYSLVEATPGAGGAVPPPVQLSAYRVVQESLANVRRHSTAHRASVVVRVGEHIEVEVLDDGSPRVGTSGTGLGLQGIRERVQHLGGDADIGPRHGAGFRVRVRFPLTSSAAARVAK